MIGIRHDGPVADRARPAPQGLPVGRVDVDFEPEPAGLGYRNLVNAQGRAAPGARLSAGDDDDRAARHHARAEAEYMNAVDRAGAILDARPGRATRADEEAIHRGVGLDAIGEAARLALEAFRSAWRAARVGPPADAANEAWASLVIPEGVITILDFERHPSAPSPLEVSFIPARFVLAVA